MADHYLKSLELLDEVANLRAELRVEYARQVHRRERVADIQQDIGRCLKLSQTHAELATGQAVRDLANVLANRGVEVAL